LVFVGYTRLTSQLHSGIITLTGLDAEDHRFPIAFAIVPTEDVASCRFFFENLTTCPCTNGDTCAACGHPEFRAWLRREDMVIFSNRSSSFVDAVAAHLSSATHV
jgi:hypothetical protein